MRASRVSVLTGDALTELEARLKIGESSIETLTLAIDARTIDAMEIGAWRTTAGDVDVLLGISANSRFELARYEQLAASAILFPRGEPGTLRDVSTRCVQYVPGHLGSVSCAESGLPPGPHGGASYHAAST